MADSYGYYMIHTPLLLGFSTGLSLIVAIGAQNAFVLRQGIRREHVFLTVLICVLSDAILILAGATGIGKIIENAPWVLVVARIGGSIFLICYAAFAFRRALTPARLEASQQAAPPTALSVLTTALALTWLNPHVYVDTVLLLGSIGAAQGQGSWHFALGAILASALWFTALGFAARYLSKVFASPKAWRVLDGIICIMMTAFAIMLIWPIFT